MTNNDQEDNEFGIYENDTNMTQIGNYITRHKKFNDNDRGNILYSERQMWKTVQDIMGKTKQKPPKMML